MEVSHHMADRVPDEAGALARRLLLGGGTEHGLWGVDEAGDVHHAGSISLHKRLTLPAASRLEVSDLK